MFEAPGSRPTTCSWRWRTGTATSCCCGTAGAGCRSRASRGKWTCSTRCRRCSWPPNAGDEAAETELLARYRADDRLHPGSTVSRFDVLTGGPPVTESLSR